jgi:hypothetical protein
VRSAAANPLVALLPSPFLGPSVWSPVAAELRTAGFEAVAVAIRTSVRIPADVSEAFLSALPPDRELVLIPHSNAGLYVPQLIAERDVLATVFVDAALPPAEGDAPVMSRPLTDRLTSLADEDGVMPPWTRWWGSEVDELFPNAEVRRQIEAEEPRRPLGYLRASVSIPAGWDRTPCAYLAFGEAYAAERSTVARRGWPLAVMSGQHLHMVVDPRGVAATIRGLLDQLGVLSPL